MSNIGIFLKPQKGFCPNLGGERTIGVLYTTSSLDEPIGKLGFECEYKRDCPYYNYDNGYEHCPTYDEN